MRVAQNNTITSNLNPNVDIVLPEEAKFIGSAKWLLFEVADCEIYVFVEADENKNIKRFYFVQFEAFISSEPTLTYDYASRNLDVVTISGMQFYVRENFGTPADPSRAGSEQEKVYALLAANGYKLPENFMNVRLVSVLDQEKRKELLIYYIEDMAPTGFTVNSLIIDRANRIISPQWGSLKTALRQRAIDAIKIETR